MKWLAFDTSGERLTAVATDGQKPLFEFESGAFAKHSSTLIPLLKEAMDQKGLSMRDMEGLAVGLGPGSFTGLRVGVAAAKTLAYALNQKIVGISSLEVIAYGARRLGNPIAVMVDARRDQFYTALYKLTDEKLSVIRKPSLMILEKFLSACPQNAVAVGSGVLLHPETIRTRKPGWHIPPVGPYHAPQARWLAAIAEASLKTRGFDDPFRLEPLYLYPRDCNVTRKSANV